MLLCKNDNNMDKQEIRWVQRLDSYRKALQRMNDVAEKVSAAMVANEDAEVYADALIHRYEFTQELAWKLMKDYLEYSGLQGIIGSRDAIRHALQSGLLDDDRWMDTIADRNITSHNYNQSVANDVSMRILGVYRPLFNKFLQLMTEKEAGLCDTE